MDRADRLRARGRADRRRVADQVVGPGGGRHPGARARAVPRGAPDPGRRVRHPHPRRPRSALELQRERPRRAPRRPPVPGRHGGGRDRPQAGRRGGPGERAAAPGLRRHRSGHVVGDGARRELLVPLLRLVRVHRPDGAGGARVRVARRRPPQRPGRDRAGVPSRQRAEGAVRPRTPAPAGRRRVPVGHRRRPAAAVPDRRLLRVRRERARHHRPQGQGGRGGGGPRGAPARHRQRARPHLLRGRRPAVPVRHQPVPGVVRLAGAGSLPEPGQPQTHDPPFGGDWPVVTSRPRPGWRSAGPRRTSSRHARRHWRRRAWPTPRTARSPGRPGSARPCPSWPSSCRRPG